MKATIWHNPRCSKSRQALSILDNLDGVDIEVFEYLKSSPSRADIEAVLTKAGISPSQALRKGEDIVKEIELNVDDEAAILDAMVNHPILIERPIVITEKGALIARPPEKLLEIL